MGFKIVDKQDRNHFIIGRTALENTVRISRVGDKLNGLKFTISGDLLSHYGIGAGDKVNLSIGTDEDYGSVFISKTTPTDKTGYAIFKGPAMKAGAFSTSSSKIYDLKITSPVDCLIKRSHRGILATIPASALPNVKSAPQLVAAE